MNHRPQSREGDRSPHGPPQTSALLCASARKDEGLNQRQDVHVQGGPGSRRHTFPCTPSLPLSMLGHWLDTALHEPLLFRQLDLADHRQ